jgi:hypothetical protein
MKVLRDGVLLEQRRCNARGIGRRAATIGQAKSGVCRPIPDCTSTFVLPVFRGVDGRNTLQRVSEDGWVVGFEEVSLGEEFVALNSTASLSVGDVPICGVELKDYICIGWAPTFGPKIITAFEASGYLDSLAHLLVERNRIQPSSRLLVFQRTRLPHKTECETFDEILLGEGGNRSVELEKHSRCSYQSLYQNMYAALRGRPSSTTDTFPTVVLDFKRAIEITEPASLAEWFDSGAA